ncbi:hypothetical protein BN1723_015673 [Verticillium longisporum]|uniref:Uncharacterized protein n=1 Tax=Verticillium longisporum TaxID=100787 RepID=A0A0G4N1F5_VERLO|nr:hypothetical protein BN1723_015673 [Verticillium longisporum]
MTVSSASGNIRNRRVPHIVFADGHEVVLGHARAADALDKGHGRVAHDLARHVADGRVLLDEDAVAEDGLGKWPVTILYGMYAGYVAGKVTGGFLLFGKRMVSRVERDDKEE